MNEFTSLANSDLSIFPLPLTSNFEKILSAMAVEAELPPLNWLNIFSKDALLKEPVFLGSSLLNTRSVSLLTFDKSI